MKKLRIILCFLITSFFLIFVIDCNAPALLLNSEPSIGSNESNSKMPVLLEGAKLNLNSDSNSKLPQTTISPFDNKLLSNLFNGNLYDKNGNKIEFNEIIEEEISSLYEKMRQKTADPGVEKKDYLYDFKVFNELLQKAQPDDKIVTVFKNTMEDELEKLDSLRNLNPKGPKDYFINEIDSLIDSLKVITLQNVEEKFVEEREKIKEKINKFFENLKDEDYEYNKFLDDVSKEFEKINDDLNLKYGKKLAGVKTNINKRMKEKLHSFSPSDTDLKLDFIFNIKNNENGSFSLVPELNLVYEKGNVSYRLSNDKGEYNLTAKFSDISLENLGGEYVNIPSKWLKDLKYEITTAYVKDNEEETLLWHVNPYEMVGSFRYYRRPYVCKASITKDENKNLITIGLSGLAKFDHFTVDPVGGSDETRRLMYTLSDEDYKMNINIQNLKQLKRIGWGEKPHYEVDWNAELMRGNIKVKGEVQNEKIYY